MHKIEERIGRKKFPWKICDTLRYYRGNGDTEGQKKRIWPFLTYCYNKIRKAKELLTETKLTRRS